MDLNQALPLLLIAAAFVLLFVLPMRQRKRLAERQTGIQDALHIGTPIMLTCGLHGTVAGLQEDTLDVQIAPGTVARFARATVLEIRSETASGTPAVDLGKSGQSSADG